MPTTLIFAALPEEYRCLLKASGPWRLVCRRPFRKYCCSFAGREWRLIETGMGRETITRATAWAVQEGLPDMILSMGFCGGITEALPVGSVIAGHTFRFLQSPEEQSETVPIGYQCAGKAINDLCQAAQIQCAQVVTLLRPRAKRLLRQRFCADATVIDMESYFTAGFACDNGIPFLCLRAVSDGWHDEIGFDLDAISSNGRVRISKVLTLLCRKPNLLPVFYQAWKRSRLAAKKLTEVLTALINDPAPGTGELTLAAGFAKEPQIE
jgi:adenosylhomocysteine nucleosidase